MKKFQLEKNIFDKTLLKVQTNKYILHCALQNLTIFRVSFNYIVN